MFWFFQKYITNYRRHRCDLSFLKEPIFLLEQIKTKSQNHNLSILFESIKAGFRVLYTRFMYVIFIKCHKVKLGIPISTALCLCDILIIEVPLREPRLLSLYIRDVDHISRFLVFKTHNTHILVVLLILKYFKCGRRTFNGH